MSDTKSDTPRTDAVKRDAGDHDSDWCEYVNADFARQLERELAEQTTRAEAAQECIARQTRELADGNKLRSELIRANKELADKICDLQIDYCNACRERDECAAELLVCDAAYKKCVSENAALHLALFHVENGINHPDEEIRMLIQAAIKSAQHKEAMK